MKPEFEVVWQRIRDGAGQVFRQKGGKEFSYHVADNHVYPNTTNHRMAKSQMAEAIDRMPVTGSGALNDLRGPSYLFAILSDPRIQQEDWSEAPGEA